MRDRDRDREAETARQRNRDSEVAERNSSLSGQAAPWAACSQLHLAGPCPASPVFGSWRLLLSTSSAGLSLTG